PLLLFAVPSAIAAFSFWNQRIPHGPIAVVPKTLAAGLMEGEAALRYPRRLESPRLLMFYRDLERPQADLDVMDKHVAELEAKVGQPLRAKIHWIRGRALGQRNLSFFGLALGSDASPG